MRPASPWSHEELREAIEWARPRLGSFASTCHFEELVASTNDFASELAARGAADGTIVVADTQTAGRGRRGRSWFSPPGAGLYTSVVLRGFDQANDGSRASGLITITAGVGLAEGIASACGLTPTLKWPNDLQANGRKLGGILAEAVSEQGRIDYVILGFGINLRTVPWPADLVSHVTSIEAEQGTPVSRAVVLVEALAGLAARFGDLRAGRYDVILSRWSELSPSAMGSRVRSRTEAGWRDGRTAGIDEDGALLVSGPGEGLVRVTSADIEWV